MPLDPITKKYGPTVSNPFDTMMNTIHNHFDLVSTRFEVELLSTGGATEGFTVTHTAITSTTLPTIYQQ